MNRSLWGPLAAMTVLSTLACAAPPEEAPAPEPEPELLVYSGRNEALIGPLLERFSQIDTVEVRVRYGETTEMAATILEEGPGSPAHLFISQDAAALGALSAAGLLQPLGGEVLARVPAHFRSPAGDWVGLSGRARTLVYNTERISVDELPLSLEDVTDRRFSGRFGVAPTNGSFQAHMAAYRVLEGREALVALLAGMTANDPGRYPKNSSIVDAVIAGEVDFGLVNHYYLWRALEENPQAPAANHFLSAGQASNFVNVAGVGQVAPHPAAARLVDFLLSEEAQRYFANETFEYPLAAGVEAAIDLEPLASVEVAEVDFAALSTALEETLTLISESGLVQ